MPDLVARSPNATRLAPKRALTALKDNPYWGEDAIIFSPKFGEGDNEGYLILKCRRDLWSRS
ncbi:MAG TPA: hypothetical protein VJ719_02230 [Chthoniobacterales bacterium]|nr:hypothetical protein [Chthoniobacterales bacterium]